MRLILTLLLLLACVGVVADGDVGPDSVIEEAATLYAAEDYERAIELLEQAVQTEPSCAECAHQLGRAYGRLAENSSWFAAMGLAKKSRVAFENAVALDPSNAQALEDLIRFYRDAPGFLGGGGDKADSLESRLRDLHAARTS